MRLILLILFSVCYADVIYVPADYSTIQEGIDASIEGDTVLVDQGIYYENLILDKSITLTSNAIYDDLTEWYEYSTTFSQYELTNQNIANTVISGSESTNGEIFQSVILINGADCIEPLIFGFTIKGGSGTQTEEGGVIYYRGGGILSNNALPEMHYNFILDNQNNEDDLYAGGGMNTGTGVDFPENQLGILNSNTRCEGDIDLSHNFYRENESLYGNTLATTNFNGFIDMSESIFDVYDCPDEEVTEVWVDTDEEVEITFEDGVGDLCSIVEDVWVSPDGDDYLNTGVSQSNAFLTITHALQMIAPDDDNDITINLTEGTFSPSTTGETFAILMISNMNLIGQGENLTILDAEQTDRVITMENCDNNTISDLSLTGGLAQGDGVYRYGGGMYLYYSNPILTNVTIAHNTAYSSGGMYLHFSNPNLTHVTISNNTAEFGGGGMRLSNSNPILINVAISNNTAGYFGGGMYLNASNPTLTHVTITGNTASDGGGMSLYSSNPILTNSIIWDNNPESFYLWTGNEEPIITYSDIEGDWEGEGNINSDPLFNEDYTLQENSPCIDAGDPSLWYEDLDGSRSDMGITGGLFVLPNFTSHDFGEVGIFGSSKQFTFYNFRETPITISSVTFGTSSFTTNTSSLTIASLQAGIINIEANNNDTLQTVSDEMTLISDELPEGLSVSLSVTGTEGNILTGNLSGEYDIATYRISDDLTIADGDTAYLHAGTEFLFEGGVKFTIYGTLKAIGTENDSIIFDNYGNERWEGFTLDNCSDQTTFEYVRISGAEKDNCGGMYLYFSNPNLTHVTISDNTAGYFGGGMRLSNSNPILTNVAISNNTANNGGGMYLSSSNPILTNVAISNNTAVFYGGGMELYQSDPILTNVAISNNTADYYGGGMYLSSSNPTLTHVTISDNIAADYYGGGMFLDFSNPNLTNSIMWGNSPESIHGAGTPLITYSDIEGGWEGLGNIDVDPLFIDPENGDYFLQESSPCIDAGIIIEGMEYYGLAPDMGAYEYCELGIYDECGVCDGDNSPNTGICDCEGTPNGYAVEDCFGVCDGDAVVDGCGVCDGDNITCNNLFIANVNTTLGTLDINIISFEEISGFQFTILGITITDAAFGNIVPADWMISSSESIVLGFSLQGTVIPLGSGTLVSVTFANFESEICLENAVLSDPYSNSLDVYLGDCYNPEDIIGCTDETACNYDEDATANDGSCLYPEDIFDCCVCDCEGTLPEENYDCDGNCIAEIDCNDECGGTAVVDECGVCGGEGAVYECGCAEMPDGDCDCNGNVLDECGECGGDDSTCTGCTDETACNYNDCNGDEVFDDPCTIEDNELCSYPEEVYLNCDGSCINDSNGDGICDELSLYNGLIPEEFSIQSIYPNPFNPITNIIYGQPEHINTQIIVYSLSGKQIETLVSELKAPGYYLVSWNASFYPSGVYLIRMESGSFTQTQKVVLVK